MFQFFNGLFYYALIIYFKLYVSIQNLPFLAMFIFKGYLPHSETPVQTWVYQALNFFHFYQESLYLFPM